MAQMIHSCAVTQILHAVAHLAIADKLAEGPATAAEIAARCAADPDATFRLLRACASLGLVVEDSQLRFAATPRLAPLRRDAPGSLRGIAVAVAALGAQFCGYYRNHPEEFAVLSEAASDMTAAASREVAGVVDTRSIQVAAELGGGALLQALMEGNQRLHGMVFGPANAVTTASLVPRWDGMRGRLWAVGGDPLSCVPPADLYLLKYILQHWDPAECVRILDNCRRSVRCGGRVILIELQLGEVSRRWLAPLSDPVVLVAPPWRERTLLQYEQLYSAAHLRLVNVTATRSGIAVMQAVPKRGQRRAVFADLADQPSTS
jgi:hypothetical protein